MMFRLIAVLLSLLCCVRAQDKQECTGSTALNKADETELNSTCDYSNKTVGLACELRAHVVESDGRGQWIYLDNIGDFQRKIIDIYLHSTDNTLLLNEVNVYAAVLNSQSQGWSEANIEVLQLARSSLLEAIVRIYHHESAYDLTTLEQMADALSAVTSFRFPEELLLSSQIMGAELISDVTVRLKQSSGQDGNFKEITTEIAKDIFRASSNLIEANLYDQLKRKDISTCSETDTRLSTTLFSAIDACLDKVSTITEPPKSGVVDVDFTSRLIEATVRKYGGQGGFIGKQLLPAAGGFFLPPGGNLNTSGRRISSKFISSMVNPMKCQSPEALAFAPVVSLEVFDDNGHPVQASDSYTVYVRKVDREPRQLQLRRIELHGDTVANSVDPADDAQMLQLSVNSSVAVGNGHAQNVQPVTLSLSSYSCLYWNETNQRWQTDGCWPDVHRSTDAYIVCQCDHLTSFTARAFFVPVNQIDFDSVFKKNLKDNTVVLATVITLFVLYVILVMLMRRKDRQDLEKWLSVPQKFNSNDEQFYYCINVSTGLRPGSGTTCVVAIRLFGEKGQSRLIRLVDRENRLKPTVGSVCSFWVSVRDHLGPIDRMDVSLKESDTRRTDKWFLDRIEVVDILTKERVNFLCYDWIRSGDGEDGEVRTLTVSDESHFVRFAHLLSSQIRVQVFDEYLWGSVLSRQMPSGFNRVQRLSCCAAILCLAMISNAMFYSRQEEVRATKTWEIGSQRFSLGTVYIALISSLVTVPVATIMIMLFKKSGSKSEVSPAPNSYNMDGADDVTAPGHSPAPCFLRCLAWILVFMSSFLSLFFLVLYSLEWGPVISKQWLLAQLTSIFLSAFIVDPSKAILLAGVFSVVYKLRKKPFTLQDNDVYRGWLVIYRQNRPSQKDVGEQPTLHFYGR